MRAILLIFLACSTASHAQTVFKCAAAGGRTVYQQTPCADEASTLEARPIREQSASTQPGGAPDARTAMARNVELSRSEDELSRCLGSARVRAYSGADARTADLQAQKRELLNRTRFANNNMAGASWEAGLRSQIAGIDAAIATERSAADALFSQQRQQCLEENRQRRADAQRRFDEEDRAREEAAQTNPEQ